MIANVLTQQRNYSAWLALAVGLLALAVLAGPIVPYGPVAAALHSMQLALVK